MFRGCSLSGKMFEPFKVKLQISTVTDEFRACIWAYWVMLKVEGVLDVKMFLLFLTENVALPADFKLITLFCSYFYGMMQLLLR